MVHHETPGRDLTTEAESPDTEDWLERGRLLFAGPCDFLRGVVSLNDIPEPDRSEIAFAGRSNVGKSSLINTLVNRKNLVKTSSTPGRTQLINFFKINDILAFVDLPGYGYARVPAAVKKKWGPMIETYLSGRRTLIAVVVILDIRRTPRQEEQNLIEWLKHHSIARILVLTKADKLPKTKQEKQRAAVADALAMDRSDLILFSTKSRLGKDDLWQAIEKLLGNT